MSKEPNISESLGNTTNLQFTVPQDNSKDPTSSRVFYTQCMYCARLFLYISACACPHPALCKIVLTMCVSFCVYTFNIVLMCVSCPDTTPLFPVFPVITLDHLNLISSSFNMFNTPSSGHWYCRYFPPHFEPGMPSSLVSPGLMGWDWFIRLSTTWYCTN